MYLVDFCVMYKQGWKFLVFPKAVLNQTSESSFPANPSIYIVLVIEKIPDQPAKPSPPPPKEKKRKCDVRERMWVSFE